MKASAVAYLLTCLVGTALAVPAGDQAWGPDKREITEPSHSLNARRTEDIASVSNANAATNGAADQATVEVRDPKKKKKKKKGKKGAKKANAAQAAGAKAAKRELSGEDEGSLQARDPKKKGKKGAKKAKKANAA
ncbi:hypothetical protein HRG_007153 [Hirsutella rhossiliensis]|uniref:Uncharacterized protein n=1 Tax=Hirsutella rhossiliensis TaxID=111463 RepID=A0A9P8SGI1_9HYPO|nr:uncharacterized protein HRG_07153 [Hirsutella rhossiliensis]KAH0962073.1 hypothetical protein HRG_07153 [Hirsutella rhossiliensis]